MSAQLKKALLTHSTQVEYINITSEIMCLHLTISPAIPTMSDSQLTGAIEGKRLFQKYHSILRHYVFPFEPFVPHTHWSTPCKNCPVRDGGLIIDNQYFCKPDHANIVPWQHFNDMSEEMLIKFVTIMHKITDHNLIWNHYRIDHTDPLSFFVGHRQYIACVEQELSRHGVPLPYLSTEGTIPPLLQGVKRSPVGCISTPTCSEGWFDLPLYSTNLSYPISTALHPERICEQKTLTALLNQLVIDWHGTVHAMISGSFVLFDSVATLFFFPDHMYDDCIERINSDRHRLFLLKLNLC